MTNRENRLNFILHKPVDHFVTYFEDLQMSWQCSGFHERPPHLQSGYDWFGVMWEYDPAVGAFVPDHRQPPVMTDICNWREEVKWPDLDSMDWDEAARIDEVEKIDRENCAHVLMLGMGPFERLHSLMGFENALVSLVAESEECKAFFEKWTEWKCKLIDYLCDHYKPDFVQFHDDSGTQNNLFYSPDTWRELIKPCWTACAAQIKKHGIPAELHSCGKSDVVLRESADCGFDSLFVQSMNDWEFIQEGFSTPVLFAPNGMTNALESKAFSGGITAREVEESVVQYVTTVLEQSKEGFVVPVYAPVPPPENFTPDTILHTDIEVMGVAFAACQMHKDEFTEIIRRKQAAMK